MAQKIDPTAKEISHYETGIIFIRQKDWYEMTQLQFMLEKIEDCLK